MKIISTVIENDPIGLNLVNSSLIFSALDENDRKVFVEKGFIASID